MTDAHIDFETRSDVDIRTRGSYIYFESPHTAPLMASYQIGTGPVRRWLPGQPCPADIRAHAESRGRFVGHNAGSFERQLWQTIMVPRYGWPALTISQWRCTMATASALGLPRSLERLGDALDLRVKKDKIGKTLIKFFCTPIRFENGSPIFNEPADHPEKFAQFQSYCDDDVRTEAEADSRMIPLSDAEQRVWELDQVINDRGVRIDRRSCVAAIRLVDKAKAALDAEMAAFTGGAVTACTQVSKLTAWVRAQGVAIDSLAKDEVIDALEFIDVPDVVRRALLARQEAAKTSTEKLKGFLKHLCADDRIRGVFNYHATRPGRWSSAGGVNVGNLPRPRGIYDDADIDTTTLFSVIRAEDPALIREIYGPVLGRPLNLISDAIRGFLWAAPGNDLVAVDYSGIQGAIGAWLAGETWKLMAMREILADPKLPDMYRRAAAGILNTTTDVVTKKHPMRQAVGKTSELALLFSGGVVALVKMAKNYGMKLRDFHDLYPAISGAADEDLREKVAKRWERATKGRDKFMSNIMSREAWMACDLIKFGWRARNPAQTRAWETLEESTLEAVRNPGRQIKALKATYLYTRGALWCLLPSGRAICYSAPRLHNQVWAKIKLEDGSWTTEAEIFDRVEAEKMERRGDAKIDGETRQRLTALGVDPQSQKLVRKALYGGKHMQNLCLGIESDILRVGMRNLEAAGYPVTMHNYDEAVAEVPRGFGSVAEAEKLMLDLPAIYTDLPLGAHGWRGKRYAKR